MKPSVQRALLALLLLAAMASLLQGLTQAMLSPQRGIDFQWSGARLLGERVDPWQTFLEGDPRHQLILGQQPNYLPELYVLLLPVGRLRFVPAVTLWAGANLVFTGLALWLTSRLFRLSQWQAVLMAGMLLVSVPLRVSFANGQQSLLILACVARAYSLRPDTARGALLGLSFAKYSFAPVLAVVQLLRGRWRTLAWATAPIVAGLLVAWALTGTPLPRLLTEPLQCAKIAVSPGYGDIMTLLQMVLGRTGTSLESTFQLSSVAGMAAGLALGLAIAWRRYPAPLELALASVATLLCFKHLVYDFVFLLFPLAALLRARGGVVERTAGSVALSFLLFFGTVQNRLGIEIGFPLVAANAAALMVLGWVLVRFARESDALFVSQE